MDLTGPEADLGPDPDEPDAERLTRNWNELLQELRVVQTGVQILTGFLLTVPFSHRFTDLSDGQVAIYLVVLCGSLLTTGFVVAPVAFHRVVFRQGKRFWLVETAHRTARIGLLLLALTSSGVLALVFEVTLGTLAGVIGLVVALAFFAGLWVVVPLALRGRDPRAEAEADR